MQSFDKVSIITGGSKGIGEGCAKALCSAGGRVVICDTDNEMGTLLADRLTSECPGECHFESCDVRDCNQIEQTINKTITRYGQLNCLVNNAGWHPPSLPIDEFSVEDLLHLIQLNVIAVFAGCKLALPHLRKTRGSIVNVSSLVARTGQEFATTYCLTKGAVSAFTKALAIDEGRHGVRVNAILPGIIYSPLTQSVISAAKDPKALQNYLETVQWLGRGGTIDEVGQACLFLASDASSFMTGVELILSGGAELGYGLKLVVDRGASR